MNPIKIVAFYIIYSKFDVIKCSGLFKISVKILKDFIICDLVLHIYSNNETKALQGGITGVSNRITFKIFSKLAEAN